MALHVRDPVIDELVSKLVAVTGETKTAAVRQALIERCERVQAQGLSHDRAAHILGVLEQEIWPALGIEDTQMPFTKAEREEILGYGPGGV
ncbi:MAG TPA: type II toxin-antitoxin system VapB family antitoxin [Solirubrobacteraceae bacterium]|jgi:antitoxin VapB|nr:type II toxin-antitoxin system VapB family antitoxin [Solirubrobacteraceae bacterium]